jgi:hypothetical protein
MKMKRLMKDHTEKNIKPTKKTRKITSKQNKQKTDKYIYDDSESEPNSVKLKVSSRTRQKIPTPAKNKRMKGDAVAKYRKCTHA